MKFKPSPFYLYPIEEPYLDNLFVNREEELKIAEDPFTSEYIERSSVSEICAVIGDIGSGKSSLLNYIRASVEKENFDVSYHDREDEAFPTAKIFEKESDVYVIDDVDKLDEGKARQFYTMLEKAISKCNLIYFSETYRRDEDLVKLRNSTVSENIILPRFLKEETLKDILKERMKNCLVSSKSEFEFPFSDQAIKMASIRSGNNLRSFFKYCKEAWKISENKEHIEDDTMKKGISMIDRELISRLDMNEIRILWTITESAKNKKYAANRVNINRKTLDRELREGPLKNLVESERKGNQVILKSIYSRLPEGKEILEDIYTRMGVDIEGLF
ncbi:MAG: ATP-binding protein [Candidatus Thermoplasmatota archaeon]|nr:ATP-binding protein [Candidatus Thermoplasmatota archaeon]